MNNKKTIPVSKRAGTLHKKSLLLLMALPILIITGFQGYWLNENFKKEKKNLDLRTSTTFRESVRLLQAKKLNLDRVINDSVRNFKVEFRNESPGEFGPNIRREKEEVAGIINNISVYLKDTLGRIKERTNTRHKGVIYQDSINTGKGEKRNILIRMKNSELADGQDSANEFRFERKGPQGEIVSFLYRVDSLQDSLRVKEIHAAVETSLKKEGIDLAFSISRMENMDQKKVAGYEKEILHQITIGFAHPVTFQMKMGNTSLYLFKKIASPILFSLFLVGVTLLSFVFLYRNLMQQKRLAEIKNDFISNITHELKTPIATVGVAIEALRNFNAISDPQRSKEYLDISQNELHRLSLLVDKVLKLSMFEKKEIELKFESLDLNAVVEEVVSSMKLQIEKHGASVLVITEGQTQLNGDRLHLLSVVFNLLDNALKYGNGNTKVTISLKEKGANLELTVADNGIGIPAEYKEKLFEKFFRVPAGDTHNAKGYGLGLSYVAHVVEKHKGKIEVESQRGEGAKFIITLPKQTG